MLASIGDMYLDTITERQLSRYLEQFGDGVTRNDIRKRAVALFRWARRSGYLPRDAQLEIEHTERAKEEATEIGVLDAATFRRLLNHFQKTYPHLLTALVIAGFCGLRSDEIQGKRGDRTKRQLWEDIFTDNRKHLRVTNAKTNTPSWRHVPLCPAALVWLKACPGDKSGPICAEGAMEDIRRLGYQRWLRTAGKLLSALLHLLRYRAQRKQASDGNQGREQRR